MKFSKQLMVAAALVASIGTSASAQVVGSLGGGTPPFLTLSLGPCTVGTPCTLGPGVGTIVGGTVYQSDQPFADTPGSDIFGQRFLAAGPTAGQPAMLSFTTPLKYISFLWGSPDTYNTLTVNSTVGPAQIFTVASLGFAVNDGNQAFSQYVQFQAVAGSSITSLVFNNSPSIDAFEVANFTITPVPEPSTYALMGAGLLAMGIVARRRRTA